MPIQINGGYRCDMEKSDILAVITELIETMQDQLQNSKRVKLDGFGSFKIGIENAKGGADTAAEFSANKHVKGLHVLFQPEVSTDSTGTRQKTFISGCTVQEAPKNDVDTTKPKTEGNGSESGNGGSNSGSQTTNPGSGDTTPGAGD